MHHGRVAVTRLLGAESASMAIPMMLGTLKEPAVTTTTIGDRRVGSEAGAMTRTVTERGAIVTMMATMAASEIGHHVRDRDTTTMATTDTTRRVATTAIDAETAMTGIVNEAAGHDHGVVPEVVPEVEAAVGTVDEAGAGAEALSAGRPDRADLMSVGGQEVVNVLPIAPSSAKAIK